MVSLRPCKKGHTQGRYKDGKCRVCVLERVKVYAAANRNKVRRYKAEWAKKNPLKVQASRLANKDKRRASIQAWGARNKDKVRLIKARWKKRNPDAVKAENARRRAKNPEYFRAAVRSWARRHPTYARIKNSIRRAQKLRAMPWWAELEKIAMVYQKAKEWRMNVDHIVPLQHPAVCGLHVWANLQLLSKAENSSKRNRHWPDMPDCENSPKAYAL